MKKLKQSDFIDNILESSERVKAYSKPVFGIGINDVNFRIGGNFNGRKINHRAYKIRMAKSYKDVCDSIHQDLYHGLIAKIQSMHIPVDVD